MPNEMKTIKKGINISAPKEKVWEVLTNNELTALWYSPFGEGVHAETDWKLGSKALFTDATGSGLVSRVVVNQPFDTLSIEHQGIVSNGVEDYESDVAKQVKGGHENYYLSENNGITSLSIECDMSAEYFDWMSAAWDKALQKISQLSGAKAIAG